MNLLEALDEIFDETEDGLRAIAEEYDFEVERWVAEPAPVVQFPGSSEIEPEDPVELDDELDLDDETDPLDLSAEDPEEDPAEPIVDDERGLADDLAFDLSADDDETMH